MHAYFNDRPWHRMSGSAKYLWATVAIVTLVNFPVDLLTGPYPQVAHFLLLPLCIAAWYRGQNAKLFQFSLASVLFLTVMRVAGIWIWQQEIAPTELSFVRALMRTSVNFTVIFSIDQIARRWRLEKYHSLILRRELEAERQKMAMFLHDDVGQSLAVVSLNLELVRKSLAPSDRCLLNECYTGIEQALQRIRNAATNFRPALLDDLGLASALRSLISEFSGKSTLELQLYEEIGDQRFASNLETVMYRVTQEAITNAVRHADANNLRVAVWQEDQWLCLEIRDDGCGFETDGSSSREMPEDGVGLKSISQQVEALNGKLRVHSSRKKGTMIVVRLPDFGGRSPAESRSLQRESTTASTVDHRKTMTNSKMSPG